MGEGIQDCKRPAADFSRAFTPGQCFQRDDWHYEMDVETVAELCLPTGKIVAADPGNLDGSVEDFFSLPVPQGQFPVDLAIRHARKSTASKKTSATAAMRVRFSEVPIAEWRIATVHNQDPDDLSPFQIYGYGVDVGMGSFADSAGLVSVLENYKEREKTLYDEFYFEQVLPAFEATKYHFADILLDDSNGANLVVCSSGHGDGFYASYWGLAGDGSPACLITDFGLLTHHVREQREIGRLSDLIGIERRLQLPAGELRLRIEMPNRRKLVVKKADTAQSTSEVRFRWNDEQLHDMGGTVSFGEREQTAELQFEKAIPDDATVVVSYLDRIEPL